MEGRVRRQGNGMWRVVNGKENVYEAREKRLRWQSSQWVEGSLGNVASRQGESRPHFCYKEVQDRGVSATCRRCRVEMEGMTHKPVPACARPVSTGIGVWRETPMVAKGREGVRERRLRNHPLDCPVCDQGGECDLQDQTMGYGTDRSRRYGGGRKRAVEDKEVGGQVKMVMTRCIHCTRCVRYSQGQRGIRGRGTHSEIGRYTPWKRRENPMSGGRVDRCPVGARTQEVKKFADRPWERENLEGVNRRDGRAQPLSRTYRGGTRIEVKPKRGGIASSVSLEVISDQTRYGRDGREYRRRETQTPRLPKSSRKTRVGFAESCEDAVHAVHGVTNFKLQFQGLFPMGTRLRKTSDMFSRRCLSHSRESERARTMDSTFLEERVDAQRRRGAGVERGRIQERKSRYRKGEIHREVSARRGGARKALRRHTGERRRPSWLVYNDVPMDSSGRRQVGAERGESRPSLLYGRSGHLINSSKGMGEKKRGPGTLNSHGGSFNSQGEVENLSREPRRASLEGRGSQQATAGKSSSLRRGSGRWGRGDGKSWMKKVRVSERDSQRRLPWSNGASRVSEV